MKPLEAGVGVFDVSHMGEFLIEGPHALDLIQSVSSNDASKLTVGKAQYSCLPNEQGGIVDDLIIYKVKEETYLLVVNASNIEKDWEWIASKNSMDADMKNISEDLFSISDSGPLKLWKPCNRCPALICLPLRFIIFWWLILQALSMSSFLQRDILEAEALKFIAKTQK